MELHSTLLLYPTVVLLIVNTYKHMLQTLKEMPTILRPYVNMFEFVAYFRQHFHLLCPAEPDIVRDWHRHVPMIERKIMLAHYVWCYEHGRGWDPEQFDKYSIQFAISDEKSVFEKVETYEDYFPYGMVRLSKCHKALCPINCTLPEIPVFSHLTNTVI